MNLATNWIISILEEFLNFRDLHSLYQVAKRFCKNILLSVGTVIVEEKRYAFDQHSFRFFEIITHLERHYVINERVQTVIEEREAADWEDYDLLIVGVGKGFKPVKPIRISHAFLHQHWQRKKGVIFYRHEDANVYDASIYVGNGSDDDF